MTNKKGKANKMKRKAAAKFYVQNIKMSPKKQLRKNKQKMHDTYTVEIPMRLAKVARQNFKK